MKESHFDFVNRAISEDGNKGLWRYVKSMRKDTCGVSTLIKEGISGSEPADKARMLNEQFSSVFTHEDNSSIPDLGPQDITKKLNENTQVYVRIQILMVWRGH